MALSKAQPLCQICFKVWFFNLYFPVNEGVLIKLAA